MNTAKVRLPNGRRLTAVVGGINDTGYRTAKVKMVRSDGEQVTIAGRITTRHGFDRTLPFEVNMLGTNAIHAFEGDDTVYSK